MEDLFGCCASCPKSLAAVVVCRANTTRGRFTKFRFSRFFSPQTKSSDSIAGSAYLETCLPVLNSLSHRRRISSRGETFFLLLCP